MAKKADRHLKCSICKNIPERVEAFWKGGELLGGELPRAEQKLEVVGAPFFNDRMSQGHNCLKQCPKCGTYYDWDFSYEFLVNGTEDEVVLTRLSDKDGEKRAKVVFETIGSADKKFRVEAEAWVKTLSTSQDGKGVYGAANSLQAGQFLGHDLSFAVPALTKAFVRFSGKEDEFLEQCSSLIYFVLREEIKESPEIARQVFDKLRGEKVTKKTKDSRQYKWLYDDCREVLRR
ncbi:MAG: hypothetical protein FVQ83_12860 [Chloroflexi bacterium]|nr:hypothetical protein [Chloroflexota bacterium]